MFNVAILASGSGSNAQNIIEKSRVLDNVNCCVVITDRKNAGVIKRCAQLNIECLAIEKVGTKPEHERAILRALRDFKIDWVFLAGYMRIISQDFLTHFFDNELGINRVINIHPSLLPAYPGLDSYKRAYDDGVELAGVTLHAVDSGVDTGPILIQKGFHRLHNDSFEDFKSRGMDLEYECYGEFLDNLNQSNILTYFGDSHEN